MLLRLAWRSVFRNWRRTVITTLAISGSLTLSIFVVALGEGTYHQIIEDAVNIGSGHITFQHVDYKEAPSTDLRIQLAASDRASIEASAGVVATKGLVMAPVDARSAWANTGVGLSGIEPSVEADRSPLASHLVDGEYLAEENRGWAVVGTKFAERLQLKLGKKFIVRSSNVSGDWVEHKFKVKGIFRVGAPDSDAFLIQVPIHDAREMLGYGPNEYSQLGVLLEENSHTAPVLDSLRATIPALPDRALLPWTEVMTDLSNYVVIDRNSNRIFIGILLFLSFFTIFNTALMSVLERTYEFVVLLALGTSPWRLRIQVWLESLLLGAFGIGVGLAAGMTIVARTSRSGIDFSAMIEGEEGTIAVSGVAADLIMYPRAGFAEYALMCGFVAAAVTIIGWFVGRRIHRLALVNIQRG